MDPDQYERAVTRAKALGFSTFSAYVTQLIRADLQTRGELTMKEEPSKYTTKKNRLNKEE